jgi:chemosensory pili system protein ChpA (sensor histidine kinase/response regulator)
VAIQPSAQSLLWVKAELDKNLDKAEKAWQRYVEDGRNEAALAETLALVREVRGVLQTIELGGAAFLAHEVERALAGIADGRRKAEDTILDTLTRALLQLPIYLERVVGTMHESPRVLLPLLNELRSAAGEAPLEESGLMTAQRNLSRRQGERGKHSDPATLARKLRPRYQSLLLAVYKGSEDATPLAALQEICEEIEETVTETTTFELWWAASAFVEALHDGGLPMNTERKQLLGRLDGALKRLAGGGGELSADERRLRDALLAHVREATSTGSRVRAVQETYRDQGRDADWSASTADLSSPSYAALRTVGGAVHDDLRFVKTQLDIYQREKPEERRAEELVPLVSVLRKAASTLLVLGLTALHDDLSTRIEALEQASRTTPSNEVLFDVAATLLKVEDGLDEAIDQLTRARALREAGAQEPEVHFSQARTAALREILVNLARVRNELAATSPEKGDLPVSLDRHLSASASVLRFLDYEKPAGLIERLRRIVAPDVWKKIMDLPQARQLFALLADAFVSVEYWLETVREQRPGSANLLENAESCLLLLEATFAKVQRGTETEVRDLARSEPSSLQPVSSAVRPANEDLESAPPAQGADEPEVTVGQPPPLPLAVAPAPAAPASERPAPKPVPTRESAAFLAVLREEPDAELFEIFRNEVREIVGQATQAVVAWRTAPTDNVAATNVRRSFHTLKGSGRLLGAERLSEFAWALENLLNRVLDGTRAADSDLVDFVSSAVDLIGKLNEELDGRRPLVPDLGEWFARTADLLRPAPAETPVRPSAAVPSEPRLAPDLYQIFREEFFALLKTLRDWSGRATLAPPPEDVLRASHTISGSAHMAEVHELAPLAEAVDHALWDLARRRSPLSHALASAFEKTLSLEEEIVAAYGDRDLPLPEIASTLALWREATDVLPLYGEEGEEADAAKPTTVAAEELPPTVAASGSPAPGGDTDFDHQLVAIFLEEGQSLLDHAQQAWTEFTEHPQRGEECLRDLRRDLHTLKGSARVAGLAPFGDLAHELEALLERFDALTLADASRVRFERLVRDSLSALGRMLLVTRSGRVAPPAQADIAALKSFTPDTAPAAGEGASILPHSATSGSPSIPDADRLEEEEEEERREEPTDETAALAVPRSDAERTPRVSGQRAESVRVRIAAEVLDQALNHVGEISIYRSRLDEQMSTIGFNLLELRRTVDRFRDQLRRLELETEAQMLSRLPQEVSTSQTGFDPLELDRYTRVQEITRALAESVNDVASLEQLLHNLAQESEALLVQQSRVTTLVQDGLMRSRLVPIVSLEGRLRRTVQQTASEQGKRAALVLSGTEAEIDRRLLERITAPLEHMVRNAVVHGLETPEERRRAGKAETGVVRCEFRREGSEVLIEVRDDGRGLDYEAIRRRAEGLGLLAPGQRVAEADLMVFVFRPGFSTASTVTQSAGRGIGMDIVASEIRDLAGTLDVESRSGEGTTIRVRLPFTLAITQALLVNVHTHTIAVPLTSIEGIARLPRGEYDPDRGKERLSVRYGGHDYRIETLAGLLLGETHWQPPEAPSIPLLLVRSGTEYVALAVDAIQGNREIVVKPVGAQVASLPGVSGATILGDGSIVLILDGAGLVRASGRTTVGEVAQEELVATRPLALVVDDSITMRRVSQRLLERHGLEVLTAKDGVDAFALMAERIPDVALVDIEMPRMDGFELIGRMRREERLQAIPVVMITSRSGTKHREHALSVGANAYLPKPYREEELLDTLARLVPRLVHLRAGRAS